MEKPKVEPDKRDKKEVFYIENLRYAIERLLSKIALTSNVIIVTDRLPLQKDKQNLVKALKKGIKEYLGRHALACRYDIFHHCSASSANLQIIDYISWAIFRKYEHNDESYYKKINGYILDEEVMTKNRGINHYEI